MTDFASSLELSMPAIIGKQVYFFYGTFKTYSCNQLLLTPPKQTNKPRTNQTNKKNLQTKKPTQTQNASFVEAAFYVPISILNTSETMSPSVRLAGH